MKMCDDAKRRSPGGNIIPMVYAIVFCALKFDEERGGAWNSDH